MADVLEVVLSGPTIKLFTKALTSLAKIGSEVLVEATVDDSLVLRAINPAQSAYAAVRLRASSFDTFRVTEHLQLGVYSKHLLAVLRTPKVDTLTLTMATAAAPRLKLQLVCSKTGMTKTYDVVCLAEPQFLCANIDKRQLCARLVADGKGLGRLLSNFHSGQSDVTLVSLPERLPERGQAGAPKRLRLVSYADPAKVDASQAAALTTRLALDFTEEVVQGYAHRGDDMAEATVNLKDFKVMVSFCESVDANVAIYFDSPGQPMVCSPDFRNRITHFFHGPERAVDFEAELVLATMVDPAAPSHVFEAGEANIEDALAARRAGAAAPPLSAPTSSGDTQQQQALPQQQQAPGRQPHAGFPFPAALPAPVQPMQPRMSPLAGSAPGPAAEGDQFGQASDPFAFTESDHADGRRARVLY